MAKRLMEIAKPAAEKRKKAGTNQHTEPSGKLPEGSRGDARDKVGAALGVSGQTAERAAAVVQAAEEDPESFGDLPAAMDAEGVKPALKGTESP